MGVELNITRAEFFADNENASIAAEEWLAYVHGDPEMALISANSPYHAVWLGKSLHEEPWLDWRHGNIYTKWPDTALYLKMLDIAKHFAEAFKMTTARSIRNPRTGNTTPKRGWFCPSPKGHGGSSGDMAWLTD